METLLDTEIAVGKQTKKISFPSQKRVIYAIPSSDAYLDLLSSAAREPIRINVLDVVSGPYVAEDDDEEKLYNLLKKGLLQNRKVILSLKGMVLNTALFYNATIGRLYEEFPREFLEENLEYVDIPGAGSVMMKRAIKMGILYRYNRPVHDKIIEDFEQIIEDYT